MSRATTSIGEVLIRDRKSAASASRLHAARAWLNRHASAALARRTCEGRVFQANRQSHGASENQLAGGIQRGPSGENSILGSCGHIPGCASGKICSYAKWPALPQVAARCGSPRSTSVTPNPARWRVKAQAAPTIPPPTTTTLRRNSDLFSEFPTRTDRCHGSAMFPPCSRARFPG